MSVLQDFGRSDQRSCLREKINLDAAESSYRYFRDYLKNKERVKVASNPVTNLVHFQHPIESLKICKGQDLYQNSSGQFNFLVYFYSYCNIVRCGKESSSLGMNILKELLEASFMDKNYFYLKSSISLFKTIEKIQLDKTNILAFSF